MSEEIPCTEIWSALSRGMVRAGGSRIIDPLTYSHILGSKPPLAKLLVSYYKEPSSVTLVHATPSGFSAFSCNQDGFLVDHWGRVKDGIFY